jgi:predicted transcriptional regulator of viral defense system
MKYNIYLSRLGKLLHKSQFTTKEALEAGVPRHILSRLCKNGKIERICKGIYRSLNFDFSDYENLIWEDLFKIAAAIPSGVICLISALSFYDLTDEIPREHWIAIPHVKKALGIPNVRFVRMRNISLGITCIKTGQYKVKIFDRERCIIDAFRYLSKEIAIKALKNYFEDEKIKKSILKLDEYAKKLRVNIKPYILAYTT